MPNDGLRQHFAQELTAPLRLSARELAHGLAAGAHRASRKGSGIEFAGHRPYSPGDDLRHLDRHALLRHGRLLIREFHTDTERAVHLVVDVSTSMRHRGQQSDTLRASKGQRALLLAAALGYAASIAGDAIGVSVLGDHEPVTYPPRSGRDALERAIAELEKHYQAEPPSLAESGVPRVTHASLVARWLRTIDHLGGRLPRGSVLFVFSDFLDLDESLSTAIARLCSRNRTIRAAQVLTRDEVDFPFEGSQRLVDPETGREVETDAEIAREDYQQRLAALTAPLARHLTAHGGFLLRYVTDEAVEHALYQLALGVAR